jgi:hypothetical protein
LRGRSIDFVLMLDGLGFGIIFYSNYFQVTELFEGKRKILVAQIDGGL